MKLHLGCGRDPKDGWTNLDLVAGEGVDVVANLDTDTLPFDDNTFDEMLGLHVIEHLRNPLHAMAELWRVAKDGCEFMVATPYGSSDDAWEDATHVRPYFHGSWSAFAQPYFWRADVGYRGDWQPVDVNVQLPRAVYADIDPREAYDDLIHKRNVAVQMTATLKAIKPAREPKRELWETPHFAFTLVDVQV